MLLIFGVLLSVMVLKSESVGCCTTTATVNMQNSMIYVSKRNYDAVTYT